jgi:hypothetical protein
MHVQIALNANSIERDKKWTWETGLGEAKLYVWLHFVMFNH